MSLDDFIRHYSSKGWQIVSRSDQAVQMRRPRQWSRLGLVLAAIGLLWYGAGLVLLILVILDYFIQHETLGYATVDELKADTIPPEFTALNSGSILAPYIILAFIFIAFWAIIALLSR